MIICNKCNSKSIAEQVWIESNNLIGDTSKYDELDGDLYYALDFNMDSAEETLFYCHTCRDITSVIDIEE